jgi:hypothetical protein
MQEPIDLTMDSDQDDDQDTRGEGLLCCYHPCQ